MPNPDKIGEFSKFYYQLIDYDTTQDEATILADTNWIEFCIKNLDISKQFQEHTFNDRCNPDIESVAPGRAQVSLSFELNELRHNVADVRAFKAAVDDREQFAILALNDERTEVEAVGIVGNFVITQFDETQPEEGANTESYTAKPAARSAFSPLVKRVHGSGIT